MLSLFEQLANNRVVKSVRKSVRGSAPGKTLDAIVRFAKSSNKLEAADEKVVAGLRSMGLITREEARVLERRIVQLEARLNVLEHGGETRAKAERAARAKATKAKPAASGATKRSVAQASREEETGPRTIRDAEASA